MSVTTAKIRAREAQRGKKAFTGIDNAGELHYAFDNATLQSIITKANNDFADSQSAKAYQAVVDQSSANNQFNADQVAKQMAFQERMSSTAHQREVKDLIAAGLNPVLSANGGASTPSGSSASADTSGTTAKLQLALQQIQAGVALQQTRENIASAQKMAKWQNDLNKEISSAQLANQKDIARIQAAASMYGANASASASRYAADSSASSSRYSADQSNESSHYNTDNPNDPAMYLLKGLFGDSKQFISSLANSGKEFGRRVILNARHIIGRAQDRGRAASRHSNHR